MTAGAGDEEREGLEGDININASTGDELSFEASSEEEYEANGSANSSDGEADVVEDDSDGEYIDTDDEYDISENEEVVVLDNYSHDSRFVANLSEHSKYLTNALADTLDLVDLDKSLVLQAQLSGKMNNENQKILDKTKLLKEKLMNLQDMYKQNFVAESGLSKIAQLKLDMSSLEQRLHRIKHGSKPALFKFSKKLGKVENIVGKYPIEYNQARDKIIERQYDGDAHQYPIDELEADVSGIPKPYLPT